MLKDLILILAICSAFFIVSDAQCICIATNTCTVKNNTFLYSADAPSEVQVSKCFTRPAGGGVISCRASYFVVQGAANSAGDFFSIAIRLSNAAGPISTTPLPRGGSINVDGSTVASAFVPNRNSFKGDNVTFSTSLTTDDNVACLVLTKIGSNHGAKVYVSLTSGN